MQGNVVQGEHDVLKHECIRARELLKASAHSLAIFSSVKGSKTCHDPCWSHGPTSLNCVSECSDELLFATVKLESFMNERETLDMKV